MSRLPESLKIDRKLGNMEMAAKNYEKALSLDPKHKGALEYQGQLFIIHESSIIICDQ